MKLTEPSEREAWCIEHHAMVSWETGKVVLYLVGYRYIIADTLEMAIEAMDEICRLQPMQPLLLEPRKGDQV